MRAHDCRKPAHPLKSASASKAPTRQHVSSTSSVAGVREFFRRFPLLLLFADVGAPGGRDKQWFVIAT